MPRRVFEDSIFEMADLWCISANLQECVAKCLMCVAYVTERVTTTGKTRASEVSEAARE